MTTDTRIPTLSAALKDALAQSFGPHAQIDVTIECDPSRAYWSFRVDVRTEEFIGVSNKDRLRRISEVANQVVHPFMEEHHIRDCGYLYFGLAPDDPPVPPLPLPGA